MANTKYNIPIPLTGAIPKLPITRDLIWRGPARVPEPGTFEWNFAEKPPHTTFNWAWNLFGQNLSHIHENGIPVWDADTSYTLGAVTLYNGMTYQSLGDDNKNHIPTNTSYWERYAADQGGTLWQNDIAYEKGDIVSHGNPLEIYVTNAASFNQPPNSNGNWTLKYGNASNSVAGLIKARYAGGILYLTNNGTNA